MHPTLLSSDGKYWGYLTVSVHSECVPLPGCQVSLQHSVPQRAPAGEHIGLLSVFCLYYQYGVTVVSIVRMSLCTRTWTCCVKGIWCSERHRQLALPRGWTGSHSPRVNEEGCFLTPGAAWV